MTLAFADRLVVGAAVGHSEIVTTSLRLLLAISAFGIGVSQAADPAPFDEIGRYRSHEMEGWTVRVSNRFDAEVSKLHDDVLAELRKQLVAISKVVPDTALVNLRKIEIWVEVDDPLFPCMCYHVSERWLKAHGVNPVKVGHVELANARNFLSWTRHQPWMVLHELAHGYHHRFVKDGHDNRMIAKAFEQAKQAGLYGEVDHVAGKTRKHYAATNPMEFFAEGTEAYFGQNDFYPFDRDDLQEYDPETTRLLETIWGIDGFKPNEQNSRLTSPAS